MRALGGGVGQIVFADPLHGWLDLGFAATMNTWWTFLMVTADGGHTWKLATGFPNLNAADILLVTPNDGWVSGRDEDGKDSLYVTHDGAKSWQQLSLQVPKGVLPATKVNYGRSFNDEDTWFIPDGQPTVRDNFAIYYSLPTFTDAMHGYLIGTCEYLDPHNFLYQISSNVLFVTTDGGRKWTVDRMVKNQGEQAARRYGLPTMAGSDLIFPTVSDAQPMLTKIGPGETRDAHSEIGTEGKHYSAILHASFVSQDEGWIVAGDDLLSTTNGGGSWTTITPGVRPTVVQPPAGMFRPKSTDNQSPFTAPIARLPAAISNANLSISNYSKHLGFDTSTTATLDVMESPRTMRGSSPSEIFLRTTALVELSNRPNGFRAVLPPRYGSVRFPPVSPPMMSNWPGFVDAALIAEPSPHIAATTATVSANITRSATFMFPSGSRIAPPPGWSESNAV
ncbi:MAG TPA: hypothetical protein VMU16_05375 [Candidatus Binataceae bacterium]|nr:hypothetical protein [Candidatus Binataceae bacterium]